MIAIDGTRMAGSANSDATRDFEQIAQEIVAEHKATDETEDEQLGEARGGELPEQLRTAAGRREFFRKPSSGGGVTALAIRSSGEGPPEEPESRPEPEFEFDEERIVARTQGREGWLREARRSSSSIARRTRIRSRARARAAAAGG